MIGRNDRDTPDYFQMVSAKEVKEGKEFAFMYGLIAGLAIAAAATVTVFLVV